MDAASKPRRHRAVPLWAHRTRRLSDYRRALGCAGVAAAVPIESWVLGPAAGPFPDDGSPLASARRASAATPCGPIRSTKH